jgi:hypothetical protein
MLENVPAGRSAAAPRAPTSRSAVTNQPRKMVVSANTPLGRRLRDMADHLAAGLGGWSQLNELQTAAVRKAAELWALSEDVRAQRLKGATDVTLDEILQLERAADRAVRRLGIQPGSGKPSVLPAPTFAEIALQAQADAARRRALELAADAANDEDGTASGQGTGDERPAGNERPELSETARLLRKARVGDRLEIAGHIVEIVPDDDEASSP